MIAYVLKGADGSRLEFEAGAGDVYMWEKRYKGKSLGSLKADIHMWDLYAIAHQTALRTGDWDGSLDDFVAAYPDLDWQEMKRREIKLGDPTQPAASDAG